VENVKIDKKCTYDKSDAIRDGAHKLFSLIFGVFAIIGPNFPKIVAPPCNENENYVVHLKEQYIRKRTMKTASKLTHKPSHKTCVNHVPSCRQTKRDILKSPVFIPTAGARSSISLKLSMLVENVVAILKGVKYFSNIFRPVHSFFSCRGEKMLIFGHWRSE